MNPIIGIVASVLFGGSAYALYRSQNEKSQSGGEHVLTIPCYGKGGDEDVLSYYKSGGIAGMIYRIDINSNKTYKLFDKDELMKTGVLTEQQYGALHYLLGNHNKFDQEYCHATGNDIIYHKLRVYDKEINLGTFDKKCLPGDLYNSVRIIDNIIDN